MARIGKNIEKALDIIRTAGTITKTDLKDQLRAWNPEINANKVIKELLDNSLVDETAELLSTRMIHTAPRTSRGTSASISGLPSTWPYKKNGGYKISPFNPAFPSDVFKFFIYTMQHYLKLFAKHLSYKAGIVPPVGMSNVKIYLSPTDKYLLDPTSSLPSDNFVFKQMVFHTQNRTNGIDFLEKERAISGYLCGYDIGAFNRYISGKTETREVPTIQRAIGVSANQAKNFFKAVKSIAAYLNSKIVSLPAGVSLHASVVSDFSGYMPAYDYLGIYDAMRNSPISVCGLGEALTFDFLKEFDPIFDLPKPDLHVKRTMVSLLHIDRINIAKLSSRPSLVNPDSIKTIHGRNNCMELYLRLMELINFDFAKYAPRRTIGNYVLDKMIYMICSGNLYLNVSTRSAFTAIKDAYRKGILEDKYKSITITPKDISDLLSLI